MMVVSNPFVPFRLRLVVAVAMIATLAATEFASPQSAPAPAAPTAAPVPDTAAPAPAQPAENQGLVNEIGKLLKNPSSLLPNFNTPRETTQDSKPDNAQPVPPADVTPQKSPSRLTVPSMVTGRAMCPVSPTGGPDCKAAADALCKAKGFSEGKSLGSDSAEKCSGKVLIPGRARQPDDCRTESFVTRAWCQ